LAVTGCGPWSDAVDTSRQLQLQLPQPQLPPDSVVLEVASVKLPADALTAEEELWKHVDEQHFPTSLRRALMENGFRFGLVGSRLPAVLRQALDSDEDSLGVRGPDGRALRGILAPRQRLQSRAGERQIIVASDPSETDTAVLVYEDGTLSGKTCEDAQCIFSLRSFPKGDGRVELELTPEVQYGQPRNKYVGHDGIMVVDTMREREIFRQLRARATLSPGQTLLLTCTAKPWGLGRQFFVQPFAGVSEKKVLLIRLAQTQLDDLFSPEQVLDPITTPRD
jgi:hypothetical protein